MEIEIAIFSGISVLVGLYLVGHALFIFERQRRGVEGASPLVDFTMLGIKFKGGRAFAIFLVGIAIIHWPIGVYVDLKKAAAVNEAGSTFGWTIEGDLVKENSKDHDGITVKIEPPAPTNTTNKNGTFRLADVRINPNYEGGVIAVIEFEDPLNKHRRKPYSLNKENVDIDDVVRKIDLKEDIVLSERKVDMPRDFQ